VTCQSRYVFEPDVEAFLQIVVETGVNRIDTLEAGSILYRAQLGHRWESHPVDPSDPAGECVEAPGAFGPERMKPLKDSTREGRVNPKGIPCLYMADESNTAMAEHAPGSDGNATRIESSDPGKMGIEPTPTKSKALTKLVIS